MTHALRRLLPICLFLSGGASLVLEVAWSRTLSLSLGNSHQAVATVVASMMAGLCLGSLAAARALPRLKHLPRAYAILEMGIGAFSALTPGIFKALPVVLAPLYALPPFVFALIRFLLVFLILLPASGGMGATLPILTAALARGRTDSAREPGSDGCIGGRLYGLNTLGAFLGTLAGGFLLLPRLGLLKTTLLGSATSLGVGIFAWLLSGKSDERRPVKPAARPSKRSGNDAWILPLYAASGGLAMVYEVTWTRVLAPLVGTSTYSFSLILAAILAGIGLGSLVLSGRWAVGIDPGRGFVVGQILLAGAAFLSTWGLKVFPDLLLAAAARTAARPGAFLAWQFLLFGAIVLLPGVILGSLFPFASRLLRRLESEAGAEVGRVYAWNTAGSIVGAMAAGFLLVESLGSERTLALASAASASLSLAGLALVSGRWFRPMAAVAGASLALAIPFLIPSWDLYRMTSGITQLLRNIREKAPGTPLEQLLAGARAPDARIVFHREGRTSTVTVVREWSDTWLRVDGKTDASTTATDMTTQVLLGQLPFFFARSPSDACVIGYGSGVTSHAVLTHPVKLLDNLEIERQVIEASRFFEKVNFRPLEDPRSRLLVEDARTALLYRPQTYDVIVSEPSNPWMAGVNNLFTSEFYTLVRRRLNRGGIFCQWVQAYEMSAESLQIILETLSASFPVTHLFASHLGGDMLLLASDERLALAPGAAALFPDRPQAAQDLARIGIRTLPDLALLYTAPVPPPAPEALLNTDDNSLIQYRAAKELLSGQEPQRLSVSTSTADLGRIFFPGRTEKEMLLELGRAAPRRDALATTEVIAGLLEEKGLAAEGKELRDQAARLKESLRVREQVSALLLWADSRGQARDVEGALSSLGQAEALGIEGAENNSRAGFILLNAGRYERAERYFDRAVSDSSPRYSYQSLAARGAARYRLGRREEGMADIVAAKELEPDQPLAYLLFGLALFDAGDRAAAFRELREGLEVAPEDERLKSTLQYLTSLPPT